MLSRISYLRKTPEGWEASLHRMMSVNGLKLEPEAARKVLRYLANAQGLAPEEARPGRFEVERRMIDYRYRADTNVERICRACHSMGRIITQRRTLDEWEQLIMTHRGLYLGAERYFMAFRFGPPRPGAPPMVNPGDVAVAHLSRAFPLRTPEWAAWSAGMRAPHLEGTWSISGHQVGRGTFYGKMTVAKIAGTDDEFTTQASYRFAKSGTVETRTGKTIVYTGFQWRGKSTAAGGSADDAWREVMSVEPGWQEMSGRWYRGAYDEFGIDVHLTRVANDPVVAGLSNHGLRIGAKDQELSILGVNLPKTIAPGGVDFGPGIHIDRVVRATPDSVTVRVSVDANATVGRRDLFMAGKSLRDAVVVYDKIDGVKVRPAAGLSRIGGINVPKQFEQFEAIAFLYGPDRKPDTDDDIEIGPVDVAWSMEEYPATVDDDDVKFVGNLDQHGLFTPNVDGPNPQRSGNRNNVGDVWVVATYQPAEKDAKPIRARALLIVTVPLFMRWDPWGPTP